MPQADNRWVHILGIAILIIVNLMADPLSQDIARGVRLSAFLLLAGVLTAQWFGVIVVVGRARRRFPGLDQFRDRLVYSLFFSMLWVAPLMGALDYISIVPVRGEAFVLTGQRALGYLLNAAILSLTAIGVTEWINHHNDLRRVEQEKEELRRINLRSRYDSLRQQVNPHFLFNSLNSLSSLIAADPVRAERFVEEMSYVYRYLLQSSRYELTPLARELDFIASYLHLLKTRFGEALQVRVDIPHAFRQHLIPPLTLQLLIENAVKHNEVSTDNPLRLDIEMVGPQLLRVKNNLQKKTVAAPSEKVGLANILAQYRLLGHPHIEVRETGESFEVTLPLIPAQMEKPEETHERTDR